MSFFSSGAVNVSDIDRSKLPEGCYRVRITDIADHIGAFSGSRTQFQMLVVAGPSAVGQNKGHIVSHKHDASWKEERARGEICTFIGAFLGLTAEAAGRKVTPEVFHENTRTVQYANGGRDVANATRDSSELPLVKAGAEAFLVVTPYFDKSGRRKVNAKTGQPSVIYKIQPLSAALQVTEARAPQADEFVADSSEGDDDLPPAPQVDALELALADGWRANGPTYFYKKGEPAQLKADALRAKYSA